MTESKSVQRRKAAPKAAPKTLVTDVEEEVKKIEAVVEKEVSSLEGKTVQKLRVIHDDAIRAEDEAKRYVHVLRQRAANAVVDIDTKAEEDVIAAKKKLAEAAKWLRQVENALENEFKDISGVHKF